MPRPFRRGGGGRGRQRPRPGGRGRPNNNRRGPFTATVEEHVGANGNGTAVVPQSMELPPMMTVEELANRLGLRPAAVIQALIKNGIFATMNQVIDYDTAAIVAADLGFEVSEATAPADVEDER